MGSYLKNKLENPYMIKHHTGITCLLIGPIGQQTITYIVLLPKLFNLYISYLILCTSFPELSSLNK